MWISIEEWKLRNPSWPRIEEIYGFRYLFYAFSNLYSKSKIDIKILKNVKNLRGNKD